MNRIWNVRLNLDAAGASLDAFPTDAEQGQWFRGFRMAARGADLPELCSKAMEAGWMEGRAAYEAAVAHQRAQSEKGKRSAEARSHRPTGPQPIPNHGSTAVQPDPNRGPTGPRPIEESNNRIIETRTSSSSSPAEADLFDTGNQAPLPPLPGLPPQVGLPDLQHLGLLVTAPDRERIDSLIRLYTGKACAQGVTALMKTAKPHQGKRRVFVGQLADWLRDEFELDADDYRRAGMAVPPDLEPPAAAAGA